jgi:hypothetical protein
MWPLARTDHSEELRGAIRRFESGLYEQAGVQALAILQKTPNDPDALYLLRLVERRLARTAAAPVSLIWQVDPKDCWESTWLRYLLAGTYDREVVDGEWSQLAPAMIVVDNRLVRDKADYYRNAFQRRCRVVLVHLSDEAFKDDTGIYAYCDGVLRNYHTELLADMRRVDFMPLGYKSGFERPLAAPKTTTQRQYLWSFAGDAKKLTRNKMLDAMSALDGGFRHLTQGFGTDDALGTAAYRALLDDTVIVPCPSGWSNLETFRVYEALEAGCIPIVEKRPSFDYFTRLLGPHPMPAVADWNEAPALVGQLKSADGLETLRARCFDWWQSKKPALARRAADFTKLHLS